jgi:hypothetical protein
MLPAEPYKYIVMLSNMGFPPRRTRVPRCWTSCLRSWVGRRHHPKPINNMLRKTSSSTAQDEGAALLDKLSVQLGGATPP